MGRQGDHEMSATPYKPKYTLSRKAFWLSFWFAWITIWAVLYGAARDHLQIVALAPIVIPSMIALIVALLGVHRAFGSIDLRSIAGTPAVLPAEPANGGQ